MRFIQLLPILPALAAAQEQVPLGDRVQGWFNKAKAYLPTATPVIPAVEKVVPQKKLAEKAVTPFTLDNYPSLLAPGSEPQDWLVYVTGGNKTCFGRCGQADKAFNQSVLLFSADPTAPNLGLLDCESNQVLCSAWSAGAPAVWYFQVPQASEPRAPTTLHNVYLNITTVTPETIYKVHSEKTYENKPAYEGLLHPTDGFLAENGLLVPVGYIIYGFGAIPSWLFMIGISFFSRTMMSRRLGNPGAGGAPAGGAPAAR